MTKDNLSKTKRLTGISILIAIIVILQFISATIKFGSFTITLALVPIVIGAALYGMTAGAVFGFAFGIVVLINCIIAVDPVGNILWLANPFLTALLCLLKGAAAGFCAGFVYKLAAKKNKYAGVISATIICPIVNTSILIAGLVLFYHDIFVEWAAGTNLFYFAIIGMTGFNFLLEIGTNIVLSPTIAKIINIEKEFKTHRRSL